MKSKQTSFIGPVERTREVLDRAAYLGLNDHTTNLAVSGGLDSVIAADIMARIAPEYGFDLDTVIHINTGASVPQSRLAARVIAEKWGLNWMEQGYRKERDSLAARILENGWPGGYAGSPQTGGHGLEWANRKDKPMNAAYMEFVGQQVWVSGVRQLESKRRSGNVAENAIERDKPRRTWLSPIVGWTDAEKAKYVQDHNVPVSEAYLVLGFSAECVACSFDDSGLLTDLDLLSPELAHAIRTLAVWLYQRVRRGDIDLHPKRLCWGWEPNSDKLPESESKTQELIGCNAGTCDTRNAPDWIRGLSESQIIDRADVKHVWENGMSKIVNRFKK